VAMESNAAVPVFARPAIEPTAHASAASKAPSRPDPTPAGRRFAPAHEAKAAPAQPAKSAAPQATASAPPQTEAAKAPAPAPAPTAEGRVIRTTL
jgi:hypothetical protein